MTLYVPPVTSNIVKVLSSYVYAEIPLPWPPVVNFFQLDVSSPPLYPSTVFPVHADINATPAALLPFTVVPKSDIVTVAPPTPVAPVALSHKV